MKKVSYTFVAMVLAGCCAVVCVARESASAVDGTLPLLEACAGNDLAGAQATPFAQAGYHIYTSYAQPDRRAIVYRGVSVARDVVANDYTIGLHVKYADGTDEWPDAPRYAQGTHGPQKLEGVFFPPRPVKEVGLYAFMREGEGAAQFGQLYVGREDAATVRKPTLRMTQRPFAAEDFVCVRTADGVQCSTAQAQPGVAPVSPLASGETRLWWCDAMMRVTPLTFPSAACGARTDPITVKMARREKESVQVCLSTAADVEWRAVRAEVAVEGIEATWQRVGYVAREMGYLPHPCGVPAGERWLPEPLLPPAEMTVRKGATQGVWLTFATHPDTAPGIHRGRVRLLAGARELGAFDIAVDVASCTLPAEFAVRTAVSTSQRFMEKIYGARGAAMYRRACELMLDHALNPDDIGRLDLPDIDELERARARGMNSFCLIFWVPQVFDATQHIAHMPSAEAVVTDEFRAKMKALLTPYLEKLRARSRQIGLHLCIRRAGRKVLRGAVEALADYPGGLPRHSADDDIVYVPRHVSRGGEGSGARCAEFHGLALPDFHLLRPRAGGCDACVGALGVVVHVLRARRAVCEFCEYGTSADGRAAPLLAGVAGACRRLSLLDFQLVGAPCDGC